MSWHMHDREPYRVDRNTGAISSREAGVATDDEIMLQLACFLAFAQEESGLSRWGCLVRTYRVET